MSGRRGPAQGAEPPLSVVGPPVNRSVVLGLVRWLEVVSARSRGQGGAPCGRTTLTAARTGACWPPRNRAQMRVQVDGGSWLRREGRRSDGRGCSARAPGLISVHAAVGGAAGCGDMMIDGVSRQGCGRSVF